MKLTLNENAELTSMVTNWLNKKGMLNPNEVVDVNLRVIARELTISNILEDGMSEVLDSSIQRLDLTPRTLNLLGGCVGTIRDLCMKTNPSRDLSRVRGLGSKAFIEIRAALERIGLKLDLRWKSYPDEVWLPKN